MSRARPRLYLIHWHAAEARERAVRLRALGFQVNATLPPPGLLKALRRHPPAAVIIDLSRLPSAGRDIGIAVRAAAATRAVPLVFVGGAPEKVARVRSALPDAAFTTWPRIAAALRRALSHPVLRPVVPANALAGYSGTPLPKKLGIKPGATVCVVRGPADFRKTLGALPDGVVWRTRWSACNLLLWFVRSRRDLDARIAVIATHVGRDGIWICWPKQASGVQTDVSERVVRETGLAHGLVDYKIAAIDATWSGLKFARRK